MVRAQASRASLLAHGGEQAVARIADQRRAAGVTAEQRDLLAVAQAFERPIRCDRPRCARAGNAAVSAAPDARATRPVGTCLGQHEVRVLQHGKDTPRRDRTKVADRRSDDKSVPARCGAAIMENSARRARGACAASRDGLKLHGIVLRTMEIEARLARMRAAVASALAGCTQTLERATQGRRATASASAAVAEHRQAAEALERRPAKTTRRPTRDELLGRAAEEWYAAGDTAARSARSKPRRPCPAGAAPSPATARGTDRARSRCSTARARSRPEAAAAAYSALAADALEVEGRARFALGDGGGAVNALVAHREHRLNDSSVATVPTNGSSGMDCGAPA